MIGGAKMCYYFQHGIINDEEDVMFATKLVLFSIGTIVLPKDVGVLHESQMEPNLLFHNQLVQYQTLV
jgi:hypothetical protein